MSTEEITSTEPTLHELSGGSVEGALDQIIAKFTLLGREIEFKAKLIKPLLQSFTASSARLVFHKPGDVSGTHSISGPIGTTEFTFTLGNQVSITGTLEGPRLTVFEEISGTGTWSKILHQSEEEEACPSTEN